MKCLASQAKSEAEKIKWNAVYNSTRVILIALASVLTDKYGKPVLTGAHPPTVTGLALFLGFGGRQALLNYQGRRAFKDTVTRAKARVEEYAESRLFDKDGFQGARFTLERNFKGWREEDEATADVLSKLDSVILSLDKTMGKGGDGHA